MAKPKKKMTSVPNTGSTTDPTSDIPPGATPQAHYREETSGRGAPGSGGGSRHAAADEGSADEEYGGVDVNEPLAEPMDEKPDALEEGPPYSGVSGGAVGGTPAQKRSTGGRMHE